MNLFKSLANFKTLPSGESIEIITIADGPEWTNLIEEWTSQEKSNINVISLDKRSDNPAKLLNLGAQAANSEWLSFLWVGCETAFRSQAWQMLIEHGEKESLLVCSGEKSRSKRQKYSYESWKFIHPLEPQRFILTYLCFLIFYLWTIALLVLNC